MTDEEIIKIARAVIFGEGPTALRWTTEPPTAEGFYWSKRHPAGHAYIEEVLWFKDGFKCVGDGFAVTELGYMWFGPLVPPP